MTVGMRIAGLVPAVGTGGGHIAISNNHFKFIFGDNLHRFIPCLYIGQPFVDGWSLLRNRSHACECILNSWNYNLQKSLTDVSIMFCEIMHQFQFRILHIPANVVPAPILL